jgi:hypothetical protein
VNFARELTNINEGFNKARSEPAACVLYAEFPRNIQPDSYTNLTLELITLELVGFNQICKIFSSSIRIELLKGKGHPITGHEGPTGGVAV